MTARTMVKMPKMILVVLSESESEPLSLAWVRERNDVAAAIAVDPGESCFVVVTNVDKLVVVAVDMVVESGCAVGDFSDVPCRTTRMSG